MSGAVKHVYLPAELLVSMYNLYGGTGQKGEILCMHDVQLMTVFMEYFYNSQNIDGTKPNYFFYTLPYFYTGNRNVVQDTQVKKEYRELRAKYSSLVRDEETGDDSQLFFAADKLLRLKRALLPGGFGIKEVPESPYESAAVLSRESELFRIAELYKKKRYTGEKLFEKDPRTDFATFFELKPDVSRAVLSQSAFGVRDAEMRNYIKEYFQSDSYKLFADDKRENFAPDIDKVVDCFLKAVDAFNKRGFKNLNKKYVKLVEQAKSNMVDFEIAT